MLSQNVWIMNKNLVSCHNRRVSAYNGARINPSRARKQAELFRYGLGAYAALGACALSKINSANDGISNFLVTRS